MLRDIKRIPICRRMIPAFLLWEFHKKIGGVERGSGDLTAFFPKNPTFSRDFFRRSGGCRPDIIRMVSEWLQNYSWVYTWFSTGNPAVDSAVNTVDNYEFSTFSTGFSTGVFHNCIRLGICMGDLHKKFIFNSTPFPLFRRQ